MEFKELLEQFAAKLGMSDFSVDDDTAGLQIDDTPFGFVLGESGDTMIVVADIGMQPESADRALGSMMLKANFLYAALKGAVLFQNPDNGAFGIQQNFRLVDLDPDSLYMHVERLANIADEWRAVVAGYGQAEKALQERKEMEPAVSPLAPGGLMQV